jgi:signal transduction histidine kinase
VIGGSGEGVWNEQGATFAFEIIPAFYDTWWFRTVALLSLVSAIAAGYRRRVQHVTQQLQVRFDERLAERTRIARDLHDTLLQGTLAASLQAQLAEQMLSDLVPDVPAVSAARGPLHSAVQMLARVASEGRATLAGLRASPEFAELVAALAEVARDQRSTDAITFRVTVEGDRRQLHPHIAEDTLYIAREAIVNAYKHSRCRTIDVTLLFGEDRFQCVVRDDGLGIDQQLIAHGRDGHWGLTGMRERAERCGGVLHVRSSGAAGTEVEFALTRRLAYVEAGRPSRWRWWSLAARRQNTSKSPDSRA